MNPTRTLTLLLCTIAGTPNLPAQQSATSATSPARNQARDEVVRLEAFEVRELRSFSDQAIPDETPVSFTELGKETIIEELGSRDIPLVLNTTPSVFATTDGGAPGDARVNLRGFNQRNISILINGVPTNDIENGWLYWSNWDALGDVTSTIQVQRGLSAVTLPTPSIGGTMNIITDPASARPGGSIKFELGSDGFRKGTFVYNTGLVRDRFAGTLGLVAREGDGYADGLWSKGYGYYLGLSYKLNDANRLEFYALGSPQQHGQRTFASNIAAYDADFARNLGYSEGDISAAYSRGPVNAGQRWNPNYAPVDPGYDGRQYYWGDTHRRHERGFLSERVNYFHKPQVNLNWYSTLSETVRLDSVFYYSGGDGGGSGTLGSVLRHPVSSPYNGNVDWDATIARNQTNLVEGDAVSRGILRNSINQQDQFGLISKLTYEMNEAFTLNTGFDWRTADLDHFREVRDLLGGDYYLPGDGQYSEFWPAGPETRLGLGDRIDYDFSNTVDWLGLFVQGRYEQGPMHAFAVYGYSMIDYSYTDHFRRALDNPNEPHRVDADTLDGHQIKGGVMYELTDELSLYGNVGWVSKVPIFDGAINDVLGVRLEPENEKFTSFEAGLRYALPEHDLNFSAGYYHTSWRDRTISAVDDRNLTVTYQRGVNSDYSGLELEATWQPNRYVRFDGAASIGDWTFTDDASREQFDITTGALLEAGAVYLRDLRVGDAPQTQFAYAATVYPLSGLSIKLQGLHYTRYWSDYDAATRTDPADRGQPWRLPSYSVYDLHVNYVLPLNLERTQVSVFVHAFNIFDKVYISDATDNSNFEGISAAPSHSPQRAEVFFGAPFTINAGVRLTF